MSYTYRLVKGSVLSFAELDENFRYTEELFEGTEGAALYALAAANFKGGWPNLSGPINVPASTYYMGSYWMLVSDVLDAAAVEPGVSPQWIDIPLGQGDPAASTHAATSKATPVDEDELSFIDSEAGWSLKKLTWANLKAGVRTWLQTQAMTWAGLQIFKAFRETVVTANTSTAYTINNANGTLFILKLTGNCTYTFPAATAGGQFTIIQNQDATGSRTVTWPASVRWPDGTAPTITPTLSKSDVIAFVADGTYWLGFLGGLNYTRA